MYKLVVIQGVRFVHLPAAVDKPAQLPTGRTELHSFPLPTNTAGLAGFKGQKKKKTPIDHRRSLLRAHQHSSHLSSFSTPYPTVDSRCSTPVNSSHYFPRAPFNTAACCPKPNYLIIASQSTCSVNASRHCLFCPPSTVL